VARRLTILLLRIKSTEYMMAAYSSLKGCRREKNRFPGRGHHRSRLLLRVAVAAPPDKMVIDKIKKTKARWRTTTKAHSAKVKDCKACHHKDAAGKEQGCSAAKCHGAKAEGKKLELKEAFHKQCKDCHKKEKKGPRSATSATRRSRRVPF